MEDLINQAKEFFEYYEKDIGKFAREGKKTVILPFHDLASFSHEFSERLLFHPDETLQILETALEETGIISRARIRFIELPQSQCVKIREIRAKHLGQMISITGIVRQSSEIRPQVVNAKFECPSCGTIISVLQIDKNFREPSRCGCGRKGGFKLVNKDMVDVQRIVIEESPDNLSGGEQPRRLTIFLKEDLVEPIMEERTTPGSKVNIIGVLKEVPIPLRTGAVSVRFDLAVEANNAVPLEESLNILEISDEDEKQIRELSTDPELYNKLRQSIAPSVFGYEEVKDSLVLQLFGGERRQRSDGNFCRGDIHVLLVGDPGVAKSVILKFMASVAPKGRYVSGRATTAAGLTATVVKDEFLRGWSLEAGVMVLANRGIAAIDEIEDMDEKDRSAMHEAMEQQTVSISKANVQATLRAETSVLAAGNPKFGRFDPYQPIAQQIEIDPALLTRFDLLFMMKDLPERVRDEAIANHIMLERRRTTAKVPLEPEFLRKYIAYSKQHTHPELTDMAVDEIKRFYVDLRNTPSVSEDLVKPIPITARQLEALIRLSEANARARLSKKVTREDAKKAITLLKYCLMQVGYDYESKSIDIDKISSGITASQKSKIIMVREAILRLESRLGKLIPVDEILRELSEKMDSEVIEDSLLKLKTAGDIFEPKRGFIQKI